MADVRDGSAPAAASLACDHYALTPPGAQARSHFLLRGAQVAGILIVQQNRYIRALLCAFLQPAVPVPATG